MKWTHILLITLLLLVVGCASEPAEPELMDTTEADEPVDNAMPALDDDVAETEEMIAEVTNETEDMADDTVEDVSLNDTVDVVKEGEYKIELQEKFIAEPKDYTIKVGDTVTWTNNMVNFQHIIAWKGIDSTQGIKQGESFSHTFTEPGEYKWFSTARPTTQGTILVEE